MAFPNQAKFETPVMSPTTTVLILVFKNDEDLDLDPAYRITDQSQSKGNIAVKVDTKHKVVESQIVVTGANFPILQGIQGEEGTLYVRDKIKTVKLLNVKRIRGLEPQGSAIVNGIITPTSYNFILCMARFIVENPS